jgi:hypothetical protein
MLHIVNGDSVANKLKEGGLKGDILVWREIYSAGPIFCDPYSTEHQPVRAENLEQTLGIPQQLWAKGCEEQGAQLAKFKEYDEIVLWFEYDLFDQTMLCYLLHWFGMGDLQYWHYLREMRQGTHPLIEIEGADSVPAFSDPIEDFNNSRIRITELGRQILSGNQDWLSLNGINQWFGGVHLQGNTMIWRWDEGNEVLVRK